MPPRVASSEPASQPGLARRIYSWFFDTSARSDPRHLAGRRAEARAAAYLRRRGWRIVARNWRGGGGELDLVASRWRTLLVVEVRMRARGEALLSIDAAKLARTRLAARALVRAHRLQQYRLRLDLIGIDATGRILRQQDIDRRG